MPKSDDHATAQHRLLRAGPLSLLFDAGDLRYVKWGGREVIRRIYATVRDHNWDTVPSEISNLKSEISEARFRIVYTSTHRQRDVHFVWRADIHGADEGSIRFTFDGEAKSTFLRNRIGFCVLHPIRECAGAKCRALYVDGRERELTFPDTIAAEQPVTDLHDLAGLAHEIEPGVQLADGEAADLNSYLDVALHLDDSPGAGAKYAAEVLGRYRERLARALVFHRGRKSTTPEALVVARKFLGKTLDGVAIGAGTNADLYQLNLQRPLTDADFICWSMNPQVHAFDNASIAETPEAAAHQVASVREYFPGKPLVVSPVTLKPRFNPNATGPDPVVPPGELPSQVDPRQLSLFAAAWTLAMIKALAESGADSATFYETTGWRDVMETDAGSTLPEKFPSIAGAVFPLYHVLADVGEFAGGEVVRTGTSDSLNVATLCLRAGQRRRLLLANLSAEPRLVSLQDFDGIVLARIMDATNRLHAMTAPEEFRARSSPFHGPELELAPHAIATLDFADL